MNVGGITYFNIAFGDEVKERSGLKDKAVSNNKDTEKILATVAATILEFTGYFPDIMVYAKGFTPQGPDCTKWE